MNDNQTSRRQFLAGTTAAAAGSLILPNLAKAANENGEIRLGMVGCGGRGSGAANQNLNCTDYKVKLVAMGDAYKENLTSSLNNLRNQHKDQVDVPDDRQFVGLDAYQKVLEHCDVVILATPPGFRPMMFEAAINAGKHVFMEKPVCVDAPGARKVLEAAKKADEKGLKVVVGLQRHYQNSYRETLKQIKDGAIGDIVSAQVYWTGNRPWVRDRKPDDTEMRYQVRNWYHFTWLSGDNIGEQHIHNIDVANWFLGGHPVSARGIGGRASLIGKQYGEIFDHHAVEFTYPNGVIVNSFCRHAPGCWDRVDEVFIGTKGVARAGQIKDHSGKVIWRHKGDGDPDPYQVEHMELYDAIKNNKPLNNAYYGAESSFTAALGRYATYSGKEVKWDDAIKLDNSQMPGNLAFEAPVNSNPGPDGMYEIAVPGKFNITTSKNG